MHAYMQAGRQAGRQTDMGHNQTFFGVEEGDRNKGTSINISSTTHERKAPQRKISDFFLLLSSSIINEKFISYMITIEALFLKSGTFLIVKKGWGRLSSPASIILVIVCFRV